MVAQTGTGCATGLLLALFGAAIVLLAGMGWSFGFAGAVIGTQLLVEFGGRRDRGTAALMRWAPAIALVLALIVYAALGRHKGDSGAPIAASTALLPLYWLGSAWVGTVAFVKAVRGAELALFIAGVVSLSAGAWALYRRWRRGMLSGSLLPVYFLGYGAACAVLFSLARGGWGIQAVVAPRYYMDLLLFPVGMLWLLFEDVEARRDGASRISAVACIAIAAMVFAGHAWTYRAEWKTAPAREVAFERAQRAFLRGDDDGRCACDAVAATRTRPRPWRSCAHASCRCSGTPMRPRRSRRRALGRGWHGAGQGGNRWMKQAARIEVPPCGCEGKAMVYLPDGFAARELSVVVGDAKRTLALAPGTMTSATLPPRRRGASPRCRCRP